MEVHANRDGAIVSAPLAAPVIAATRLRKGTTNSTRGAASFAAEAIRSDAGQDATNTPKDILHSIAPLPGAGWGQRWALYWSGSMLGSTS